MGIISQKTDRTPFAKLSFPKTGSFEVYFRGKVIFSKLKHGIWPHPAMLAKTIRDILDGNVEVKATSQTTGFKEFQSKPEVPKRQKPGTSDKKETAQKLLSSPSPPSKAAVSPDPPKTQKVEEKKTEVPKAQVEEKKPMEPTKTKEETKTVPVEEKKNVPLVKTPEVPESKKKQDEAVKPVESTNHQEKVVINNDTHKPEPVKNHEEPPKLHEEPPKHHEEPPKPHIEPPKHHEEPPKPHIEPPKHHEEPPKHHEEPPKHHEEPPKHHEEPPKHHGEPPKHHEEPPKHHEEPPKHHEEPPKNHEEPPKHHGEPPKHHEEPPKHHEEPPKHHEEPPKHHEEPPKHHEEPPKHHGEPPKHHEEPPKHEDHKHEEHKHEEIHKPAVDVESENYEDDPDMQEANNEPPYPITESFRVELAVGQGKNSKIPLKNTKESVQSFHVQVKNESLIKILETDYVVEPEFPQKLKLEILPQSEVGEKRGFIIVESEKEVVACLEIVVDVN